MNIQSQNFIQALKDNDLNGLRRVSKADLHNHFVLGGSREFLKEQTGLEIKPYTGIMSSMSDMHNWYAANMGQHFDSTEMRIMLIEAAVHQAKKDGVTVLEIGEDVWGLNAYFDGQTSKLVEAFNNSIRRHGQDIELRLQIGLSRHCNIKDLEECIEPFWNEQSFYSIDLYGDELYQPIENFIPIYRKAKAAGLKLKAHVGEWGTADDVRKAVELLELDEVQHGISAASSKEVMLFLAQNSIRLNITPTSNLLLGRVLSYEDHPIKELYQNGIEVTINSDDILIFDSDVSKEYLRLYNSKTLTAEALDEIRLNGLRYI